jgi:hypothetical protein
MNPNWNTQGFGDALAPRSMRRIVTSLMLLATAASAVSFAQTLPTPSRTVFKCNVNGKTTYSDSPCLGAERLEIEPSRGVGKTAGPDVHASITGRCLLKPFDR